MDNLKIIGDILQTLQKATSSLQGWQTKTMIDFEEQKAVADLLRQAISDVWAVASTDVKREKENSQLIKKLDAHKEQIRKALTALTEQLNNLEVSSTLPEPPAEKPELKTTTEKPPAKPRSAALQEERSKTIIDTFVTGNENSPTLSTPVENLLNAIGVSDKFLFIRELFNHDEKAFQAAVNDLDHLKNMEEAQQYLALLFEQVDKNSDALQQFTGLVYRRYMSA
jgi:DNA-binding phage protein